ncbi:MAG: hypothetical protein JXQ27_04145 [Acidobacteria bacterium]|nr:hypothetical protein [Acidobacteriota bacterium]
MKSLWIISMIVLIVVAVGVYQAVTASIRCDEYEIAVQRTLNNDFREREETLKAKITALAPETGITPLDLKIDITRGLRTSREIQTLIPDYEQYPLASFVVVAVVEYKQRILLVTVPLTFTAFKSYERNSMPAARFP